EQSLKSLKHIFLLYETHFAIDLRKLRLTIGAKIFVAKAFYNLIITIITAYHQQLLKSLRTLRQRIKLSFVHTRGYNEITRAFGGGFDKKRCLNIPEALRIEVIPHRSVHL